MHKDAMPKNVLWRFLRALLLGVAMLNVVALLKKELSLGGDVFFLGFLIAFFLMTLTDRELFYYGGARPESDDEDRPDPARPGHA